MTLQHEPTEETRQKVYDYAAVGITQGDISKVIGVDEKTLRKHYRKELDTAAIEANGEVGGALFRKAKEGDTPSMIWWTKSKMGWKEDKGEQSPVDQGTPSIVFQRDA